MSSAVKFLEDKRVDDLVKSGLVTYTVVNVDSEPKSCRSDENSKQALEDAVVKANPRKYQLALFEKVKLKNTVVNLGTGQGKTLVALLCIKHFSVPAYEEGKQTLFLVPSIALAVQHTTILRAILPFK